MDPGVANALIGAAGTIIAAFTGVLTWYLTIHAERRRELEQKNERVKLEIEKRTERDEEEKKQRMQRVIDLVIALHSEILAGVVANRRQLTPDEIKYARANLTPFATPDETDFVIDSVRPDITLLPADVIHSVVQYYRVAKQSNLLTRDLRDPVFAAQKEEEKDRFKVGLLQVLEYQKELGELAIADLAEFAKGQGIDLRPKEERAAALVNRVRDNFESITKQSG